MLLFINAGLAIYDWASEQSLNSQKSVAIFLVSLPAIVGNLVKYIVIIPLTELAKLIVGDKVVGVVTQEVNCFAGVPEQYIEHLMTTDPAEMDSDDLFNLSYLNSELSDVNSHAFEEPVLATVPQPGPVTEKKQTANHKIPASEATSKVDPGRWFNRNKRSVLVVAGGIAAILLIALVVKFILSIDFKKNARHDSSVISQTNSSAKQQSSDSQNHVQSIPEVKVSKDSLSSRSTPVPTMQNDNDKVVKSVSDKQEIATTAELDTHKDIKNNKEGQQKIFYGTNGTIVKR